MSAALIPALSAISAVISNATKLNMKKKKVKNSNKTKSKVKTSTPMSALKPSSKQGKLTLTRGPTSVGHVNNISRVNSKRIRIPFTSAKVFVKVLPNSTINPGGALAFSTSPSETVIGDNGADVLYLHPIGIDGTNTTRNQDSIFGEGMSRIASAFARWRIVSMKNPLFIPNRPSTTSGSILLAYVTDPVQGINETAFPTYSAISSCESQGEGSIWEPFEIKIKDLNTDWLFVEQAGVKDAQDPQASIRQSVAGAIFGSSSGVSIPTAGNYSNIGSFRLEGVFEFDDMTTIGANARGDFSTIPNLLPGEELTTEYFGRTSDSRCSSSALFGDGIPLHITGRAFGPYGSNTVTIPGTASGMAYVVQVNWAQPTLTITSAPTATPSIGGSIVHGTSFNDSADAGMQFVVISSTTDNVITFAGLAGMTNAACYLTIRLAPTTYSISSSSNKLSINYHKLSDLSLQVKALQRRLESVEEEKSDYTIQSTPLVNLSTALVTFK